MGMWQVVYHPGADQERGKLPGIEREAIANAVRKLEVAGPQLRFPHSSGVKSWPGLRELRPRGGRCAWRALYARRGDVLVILAIGPEAESDPRGFARACQAATGRLAEVNDD